MATQLRVVSPTHRAPVEQILQDLAEANTRLPIQIAKLRQEVATYERIYGMSSEEMTTAVAEGKLSETHEICSWLMKLQLLDDVTPAT